MTKLLILASTTSVASLIFGLLGQMGGDAFDGGRLPVAVWNYTGGAYETTFSRPRTEVDAPCGDVLAKSNDISGRVVEYDDGSFLLEGYNCRILNHKISEGCVDASESDAGGEIPQLVVKEFSLSNDVFVLAGEMEKEDFRYCFRVESPASRTAIE